MLNSMNFDHRLSRDINSVTAELSHIRYGGSRGIFELTFLRPYLGRGGAEELPMMQVLI